MTVEKTMLATPVAPHREGVGVEQRAARTLDALRQHGRAVEVIVCRPAWDPRPPSRLEPLPGEALLRRAALRWPQSRAIAAIATLTERVLPSLPGRALRTTHDRTAPTHHFHAFRLAAASARPRHVQRAEIDLDDLESEVARQIAELAKRLGDHAVAAFYAALAKRLDTLETRVVRDFDRAYVGSRVDAEWLASRVAIDVRVLPNVVDLPDAPRGVRAPGPTRLLFVGALGYYPNIDALRVLVDDVLPRIAARHADPFELHVVGRGAPPWLVTKLAATPSSTGPQRRHGRVVFHGAVPSMAPHLAAADALVVPLRAGGGTRIKLLEAFAHRVPVIATTIGAFGLDVTPERELVIADGPDAIAEACIRFVRDPDHGSRHADAAHTFVAAHHRAELFAQGLHP